MGTPSKRRWKRLAGAHEPEATCRQTKPGAGLIIALTAGEALLHAGAALAAAPHPRFTPNSGTQTYHYEERETTAAGASGYSTDFRLRAERSGRVLVEVMKSATFDGKAFAAVVVDPTCAAAMNARPGELAGLRLYPLDAERAKLGEAFLANCAPPGVFYPLTDILNVVLIQASDRFRAGELKTVGQAVDFPGFSTTLNRAGLAMSESAPGGRIALTGLADGVATLEWRPAVAQLHMDRQAGGRQVALSGSERFAFRLSIDARSGWLRRAETLYDDLDLTVVAPNLAADKAPRVSIKRAVTIVETGR
jgi:hypothetical protein